MTKKIFFENCNVGKGGAGGNYEKNNVNDGESDEKPTSCIINCDLSIKYAQLDH